MAGAHLAGSEDLEVGGRWVVEEESRVFQVGDPGVPEGRVAVETLALGEVVGGVFGVGGLVVGGGFEVGGGDVAGEDVAG